MKQNQMMDWPVVDNGIRSLMRNHQKPLSGPLADLQKEAQKRRVPIIPHETVVFLDWLFDLIQPQNILEVGTAIGFSSLFMADRMADGGRVTTIERNPQMVKEAQSNFERLEMSSQIQLIEGDAAEVLETLVEEEPFDFVFMDSAKAKYIEFFPRIMSLMKVGGVLAIDDVFQGGSILYNEKYIPRRVRKIHRKLNELLDETLTHDQLKATLLPLGDGLLMITKQADYDFSYLLDHEQEEN